MYVHTSPDQNLEINDDDGVFGSFLFFTRNELYQTTAGSVEVYGVREQSVSIISASTIFFDNDAGSNEALQAIIDEVAAAHGVDEDTACSLIDGSESGWNTVALWDGESDWEMQHYTAKAAKACGYDGVEVEDEQGTSVMINCKGRKLRNITKFFH